MKQVGLGVLLVVGLGLAVAGCNSSSSNDGPPPQPTDTQVRTAITAANVTAPTRPAAENQNLVTLGQALFFDKLLSGNRNISCATCHHPTAATADALPLSLGEGASGTGTQRSNANGGNVIPRSAPDVFNDGVPQTRTMFWDGRISFNPTTGALTTPEPALNGANPPRPDLRTPLDGPLSAQAMFPVTSHDEMRGQAGTNEIADAANNIQVWERLMARLIGTSNGTVGGVAGYRTLFQAAYPSVANFDDFNFAHAARAIAAFERESWTALDSPFDRYLAGDNSALSDQAKRGAMLFFGAARCSQCHNGPLLTDESFHSIGVPQLGPGKEGEPDDRGRALISGSTNDNYKFRTPALRNVDATGPWMHGGAFSTLRAAVQHHLDPVSGLNNYDVNQLPGLFRPLVDQDAARLQARIASVDPILLPPIALSSAQLDDLVEFLRALTDQGSLASLANDAPTTVPSGLPIAD